VETSQTNVELTKEQQKANLEVTLLETATVESIRHETTSKTMQTITSDVAFQLAPTGYRTEATISVPGYREAFAREYFIMEMDTLDVLMMSGESRSSTESPSIDLPYQVPEFILKLQDRTVQEDDSLQLKCILKGYPVPSVHWYYNGNKIVQSRYT
jgi:hypothetical protein